MTAEARAKIQQWIRDRKVVEVETSLPEKPTEVVTSPKEVVEPIQEVATSSPVAALTRQEVILGNCIEVLKKFPDNTFSAVVTDPPYGLEFMSKEFDSPWKQLSSWQGGGGFSKPGIGERKTEWPSFSSMSQFGGANPTCGTCGGRARGDKKCSCEVPDWKPIGKRRNKENEGLNNDVTSTDMARTMRMFQEWNEAWAKEVLRVLKPGGHLLSFGSTRTSHRMVCGIEEAGFQIRDKISYFCEQEKPLSWVYGCISEDTEILVDGRWDHYHKLVENQKTLCYDIDKDEFGWMPIQEVFVYEYNDIAYRIQSDYTDQIVSRNHRCVVERDGKKEFRVAEEIWGIGLEAQVPVVENLRDLQEAIFLQSQYRTNSEELFLGLSNAKFRDGGNCLFGMREDDSEVKIVSEGDKTADLFKTLLWDDEREGVCESRTQGQGGVDKGECRVIQGKDDGTSQSGVAGRSYIFQDSRELCRGKICQMPGRVPGDGAEGRICDGSSSDCRQGDGKDIDKKRGGPSCQSRSNGQSVREPDVVFQQSGTQGLRGKGIVTTTLARIEPIHYSGKVWCVRVPTGAFVARRNGKIFITGNSGFPKSLNLEKAFGKIGDKENAEKFRGMGTSLKPAHESIAVFGKNADSLHSEVPFKYQSKASTKERNRGCENLFWLTNDDGKTIQIEKDEYDKLDSENESRKDEAGFQKYRIVCGNNHVSVKPLDLIRYLVKLVKMPGDNLILDPFLGSGTLGVACILEGCDFVGIEMDENYVKIAKARIDYAKKYGEEGYK